MRDIAADGAAKLLEPIAIVVDATAEAMGERNDAVDIGVVV
jgi:hypothetical protein